MKPEMRFNGYTEDWEQRKLGEVSESYSGGTPSVGNKSYYGGSIPFIRSAEINSESTELFLTEEGLTNSSARMVSKGDILYALYGATSGETGRSRINGAINQAILAILPHDGYDSEFLMQWLRKSKQNITDIYLQGGQGNLSGAIVKALEVNFPSLAEQRQIGNYFQSIDKLITLHQRKLERLINVKKSMLKKMFPQDGEKKPEIRFEEFTGDWEQRKLDDVAQFSKGHGYSKGDLVESGTPIILYGRLYTRYETLISDVDTFVVAKNDSIYSKGGEVIVPASGETAEDIARAATVEKAGVLLGGDLNVITPNSNVNSEFISISISNGTPQRELAKRAQGKSVVHIHNEDIKNLLILFPSIEEQEKIAKYFWNLDQLITLQKRKVEKLQDTKKAFLNKMFV